MPKKLLLLPPLSASSTLRVPRASPAARPAMNAARTGYRVFSANSTAACTELAKRITERLGAELGKSVVYQETNGETRVEIKESVRGQDVFIIQTIPRDVNTAVMELLIMAYALKTACARNITGVIPYFPYSKQSKMRKRGSIVCKLLASMLAKAGLTHIITMDLHQKEIQGFFSFPVDNLRASPFLLQYIQEEIPNYRNAVIVAKSPDAAKRAQSYAERLRLGLAVIHGEAQCTELDMDDGRHSPPMVKNATVHPGLELPLSRWPVSWIHQQFMNQAPCRERRGFRVFGYGNSTRDDKPLRSASCGSGDAPSARSCGLRSASLSVLCSPLICPRGNDPQPGAGGPGFGARPAAPGSKPRLLGWNKLQALGRVERPPQNSSPPVPRGAQTSL
uniref:Phosphoribosyl pyrophosphate synthetase associated protein 1 n=1 Tax=Suricata suricatta TaxID=37032 RepID=A0A673V9Z6_SURSU